MDYMNCYIYFSNDGEEVYVDCEETETSYQIPMNCVEFSIQEIPRYHEDLKYIGLPKNYKLVYVKDIVTGNRFFTFDNDIYGEVPTW